MEIQTQLWGEVKGIPVYLYTLNNGQIQISITNYGSTIVSIWTPDKEGNTADVVLGRDDLPGYLDDHPYFGSTIGRFANRIAGGKFTLEGKTYELPQNNGKNCLHGGNIGFDKRIWDSEVIDGKLVTKLFSPHLEEGFPGGLEVYVTYFLTPDNNLAIGYKAVTDQNTFINLTDHCYFNLSGGPAQVLDHYLHIRSGSVLELNEDSIPTGQKMSVENTCFDFRRPSLVGEKMKKDHQQFKITKAFDHNYVLDNKGKVEEVATLLHPGSGRILRVYTDLPGLQLYTGNFLQGVRSKHGRILEDFEGLCLETQFYPDSPNQSEFPSCLLTPTQPFKSLTIYHFGLI